jgi:hypothetical protein
MFNSFYLSLLFVIVTSFFHYCSSKDSSSSSSSSDGNVVSIKMTGSNRQARFPSIEARVKLYMSNWYTPPCQDYIDGFIEYKFVETFVDKNNKSGHLRWPKLQVKAYKDHPLVNQTSRTIIVESSVDADTSFFMEEDVIVNCANYSYDEAWGEATNDPIGRRVKFRLNMRMYCADVADLLLPPLYHVELENRNNDKWEAPPTILQFGDNKMSHYFGNVMIPHIKKFRSAAASPTELARVTEETCVSKPRKALRSKHGERVFQPIVWKLATDRHYKKLYQIYREDTPWYKKKDMAIFRGQLTGTKDGYDKTMSDEENCLNLRRCRLVYKHGNSSLIDASLTSTRGRLPTILNGVTLESEKVTVDYLLQYKGIIMIEGNDVASGLKWALLSQSVVLMPHPKHTSWCMEELLQPWVVSS